MQLASEAHSCTSRRAYWRRRRESRAAVGAVGAVDASRCSLRTRRRGRRRRRGSRRCREARKVSPPAAHGPRATRTTLSSKSGMLSEHGEGVGKVLDGAALQLPRHNAESFKNFLTWMAIVRADRARSVESVMRTAGAMMVKLGLPDVTKDGSVKAHAKDLLDGLSEEHGRRRLSTSASRWAGTYSMAPDDGHTDDAEVVRRDGHRRALRPPGRLCRRQRKGAVSLRGRRRLPHRRAPTRSGGSGTRWPGVTGM